MPKLTATPEMKQAAIADEPKQHESPYGYRYVERTYYPYMNCVVQDGIETSQHQRPQHNGDEHLHCGVNVALTCIAADGAAVESDNGRLDIDGGGLDRGGNVLKQLLHKVISSYNLKRLLLFDVWMIG